MVVTAGVTRHEAKGKRVFFGIDHATFVVQDCERSLAFYRGVLGMALDPGRPDLGYPGAWLQVGAQQIHLMELPRSGPVPEPPGQGGRDRHIALQVASLLPIIAVLDEAGVSYTRSRSGRNALFCRDPDGNTLEFVQREKSE